MKVYSEKDIREAIKNALFGKKVGGDLYFLIGFEEKMPVLIQEIVNKAKKFICNKIKMPLFDVVKVSPRGNVSLLSYPNFISDPHPALFSGISCSFLGEVKQVMYNQENPWILHRKELFIPKDNPYYKTFSELTQQEEELGLLNKPPGKKKAWEELLASHGVCISNHQIVKK